MSGFFSKLLERVIPSTPAIEPRRASRFEDRRAPAERMEFDPEISTDVNVTPALPRVQPRHPEMEKDVRPRPAQEFPFAPPLAPPSSNRFVAGEESQPNRKGRTDILPQSDSPTVAPAVSRSEITTIREIHIPVLAPLTGVTMPLESKRSSHSPDSLPSTPIVPIREIPVTASPSSPPVSSPIIPRISKPSEQATAVGERMLPLNQPATQEPPRIQVTIGSIEIRAAVAQPTGGVTRSFKEPPTPISLKDHLDHQKRRRG